jgi:hypothetical protein
MTRRTPRTWRRTATIGTREEAQQATKIVVERLADAGYWINLASF